MEYTITELPKSRVEINITLPFSEFEPHVRRGAIEISEKKDIEGFRKGKAPYHVVKDRIGEAAIYEEAADLAVRKTYPEVMKKIADARESKREGFLPIGRPDITVTKLAPDNEMQYKVTLSLLPQVGLPPYKDIAGYIRAGEKKEVSVSDEEVDKTIDWIRDSRTKIVAVNRPVQMGDVVQIDFEVRRGGVKIEGGEDRNHSFVLGKGKFIPGFEEELVGMTSGQEKSFTLVVPEDWREKSLAGQAVDVKIAVKGVQERIMPDLDDAFAKHLGSFSSVFEFRKSVEEGILKEKQDKERQRVRMRIIEEIAGEARMDLPDVLVDAQSEKMAEELKGGTRDMGLEWDRYLSHLKKTEEELRYEWRPEAEKRARVALCLREIAIKENIGPSDEEVKTKADEYLQQFASGEETRKDIDPERLRAYTKDVLRNEKVFEFLEQR